LEQVLAAYPSGTPATGVIYFHSRVTMADITDGTSNTYVLGEKSLDPDYYYNGLDWADNEGMYTGGDNDTLRTTHWNPANPNEWPGRPVPDTPGTMNYWAFGSAHLNGLHMAFCDGSVQMINYSIDPETHRRLGNRKDGLAIDAKSY
jgi:prepilin-type processing-associated H-X9-DG protein